MTDKNSSIQSSLANLAAYMKQYLLQEYSLEERIPSDRETFLYFRNLAMEQKKRETQKAQQPVVDVPKIVLQQIPAAQNPPPPPKPIPEVKIEKKPLEVAVVAAPIKKAPEPVQVAVTPAPPLSPQSQSIHLEPLTAPTTTDFTSIRTCFIKLFPQYPLIDEIPQRN
jgi:hypothetical protein